MDQDHVWRDHQNSQSPDVYSITRYGCWCFDTILVGFRGAREADGLSCDSSLVTKTLILNRNSMNECLALACTLRTCDPVALAKTYLLAFLTTSTHGLPNSEIALTRRKNFLQITEFGSAGQRALEWYLLLTP